MMSKKGQYIGYNPEDGVCSNCGQPWEVCRQVGCVGGGGNKKNGNPKDRLAAGRLDLGLFPVIANAYGALAMTEGALKYGAYNWREPGKGVRTSVYYAACRRHLDKYLSREWEDPDTGVPHLASALACIAILIDAHETNCLTDDRPPIPHGDKGIFEAVIWNLTEKATHLHKKFPLAPPWVPPSPPAFPPAADGTVTKPSECKHCGCTRVQHSLSDVCPEIAGIINRKQWEPASTSASSPNPSGVCRNCGNSHLSHAIEGAYCIGGRGTRWSPQNV